VGSPQDRPYSWVWLSVSRATGADQAFCDRAGALGARCKQPRGRTALRAGRRPSSTGQIESTQGGTRFRRRRRRASRSARDRGDRPVNGPRSCIRRLAAPGISSAEPVDQEMRRGLRGSELVQAELRSCRLSEPPADDHSRFGPAASALGRPRMAKKRQASVMTQATRRLGPIRQIPARLRPVSDAGLIGPLGKTGMGLRRAPLAPRARMQRSSRQTVMVQKA
jgi:hypothetical protein